MPSLLDNFLKGLGSSSTVKDYAHASRIFVSESFLRSPKFAHMFYVVIDYVQNDVSFDGLITPLSQGLQLGALCKSVSLPKYTIENQVFNAYNRPNIVQKKIKYDPVTLKFHDDSADIVRDFWYDYMSFFYRDSDYEPALYRQNHKYEPRQKENWGYGIRGDTGFTPLGSSPANYNPIKAINIFNFTQGRFSEYMLINPTITAFKHGEQTSDGSALLEHEMTVVAETVKYYKGYVTEDTFGDSMLLLYDRTPSSLTAGSTRSIFGPGGLVGTVDAALEDLADGNFLGAFQKINRATQTFKGVNIGDILRTEGIETASRAILSGQNPLSTVAAPNIGDVTNNIAGSRYQLAALAGGGLAVYGATQILGGSNSIGPEARVATSRPATPQTDNTSLTAVRDYRATSGNEVVATNYRLPVRASTFPQLPNSGTSSAAQNTGVRELANYSVQELSQELAARQQINLNTSQNLISGSSQGFPRPQSLPPSPNSRILSTNYVVKFAALQNEIDDMVVNTPEDSARLNYLKDKMATLLNNPLFTSAIADDPDLLNARQSYIYALQTGSPPVGIIRDNLGFGYITSNEYTNATNRLKSRILGKADETQAEVINKFDTLRASILAASSAGDYNLVLDLIKQFLSFSKESLVVQAFDGIIDSQAFANAYGDWFTKFAKGQVEPVPDIKTFWVT